MLPNYTIHQGDNRDTLKTLEDNSIDAIITDPPYGIDFLGKAWDANTGALETYTECLRVLKPGGYILAFSAARTYHHLAVTLEQAGFEIRDQLMWLYASGFPKAQDIGKAIDKRSIDNEYHGWKTALKPSHEPICMARKPFKGSTIDNVLAHGVGALNIDATRIGIEGIDTRKGKQGGIQRTEYGAKKCQSSIDAEGYIPNEAGRFPSNVIGEVAKDYQKYFYCPKVSRKERHIGFENPMSKTDMLNELGGYFCDKDGNPTNDSNMCYVPGPGKIYIHGLKHEYEKIKGKQNPLAHIPAPFGDVKGAYVDGERMAKVADDTGYANVGNNHPTVKPVALMRYLIKLVTPPNSTVLDPFTGSGSTGMAATELGHEFIGCELDPNYVEIAKRRIEAWNTPQCDNNYEALFYEEDI